jgi:hypothetical protein
MAQASSRTEVQQRHLRQQAEANDNGRSSLITKMDVIEKSKLRFVHNICLTEALYTMINLCVLAWLEYVVPNSEIKGKGEFS